MLIRANSKQNAIVMMNIGATNANSTADAPLRCRSFLIVLRVLNIFDSLNVFDSLVVEFPGHSYRRIDGSIGERVENEGTVAS